MLAEVEVTGHVPVRTAVQVAACAQVNDFRAVFSFFIAVFMGRKGAKHTRTSEE